VLLLPSVPFVHFLLPTQLHIFFPRLHTEEEQRKEKELINREAESRRVELATALSQPIRANHVAWGNDTHSQQPHPPPPPSFPPPQVPVAVIPILPVVTSTPSVPLLPLATQIAAEATLLNGSPPVKNASSPPQQQHHELQQPPSPHLLCPHQIKVETSPQLIGAKPSQSPPEVQIQYSASISTNGAGSLHALVPHQLPPSSQPRPNGVMMEDLRGLEGKRRPGGSVCVCVCWY